MEDLDLKLHKALCETSPDVLHKYIEWFWKEFWKEFDRRYKQNK